MDKTQSRAGRSVTDEESDVRHRLLDTALRLFGERGFGETSIRDLALAANVNIAAVNYHFGSKENLRIEALRYGFAPTTALAFQLGSIYDEARTARTFAAAEEGLRRYILLFLKHLLAEDHRHWTLIMREQLTPGPVFEMIMREYLEPIGRGLGGIVKLLLPHAPDGMAALCVRSIVGQCVHLRYSPAIVRYFSKDQAWKGRGPGHVAPAFIHQSANHIAEFSIQALRGMRSDLQKHSRTCHGPRQSRARR